MIEWKCFPSKTVWIRFTNYNSIMKKRILFIIGIIDNGGVARSIINLLNVIDTDKYDISLLLISPTGELMPLIPKSIKIISNCPIIFGFSEELLNEKLKFYLDINFKEYFKD